MGRVSGLRVLHADAGSYPSPALERLRGHVARLDLLEPSADLRTGLAAAAYDAVFVGLVHHVDRHALMVSPLRWVITPTTSLGHIDTAAAMERSVEIISLAGEQSFLRTVTGTAEYTWALILASVRHLRRAQRTVQEGGWSRGPELLGVDLRHRTLGIMGYGRVGRLVARTAHSFEMQVLAHDPHVPPENLGVEWVDKEGLFARSDVITLHMNLSDETRGIVDQRLLAFAKPGAVLVNAAQGDLVDDLALLEALRDGRLAAAALDVLAGESEWRGRWPPGHPLLEFAKRADNLLITPHLGGYADQSVARTRSFVVDRFLERIGASRADDLRPRGGDRPALGPNPR